MIRTISIPYYTSSMDLHVEEKNLKTVITAKTEDYVPEKSPKELIEDALEHPIGTPKLSELAKGKNKVVLVTSDHTRAVPSRLTLPILLKEIRKGNRCRHHHPDRHRTPSGDDRGGTAPHVRG